MVTFLGTIKQTRKSSYPFRKYLNLEKLKSILLLTQLYRSKWKVVKDIIKLHEQPHQIYRALPFICRLNQGRMSSYCGRSSLWGFGLYGWLLLQCCFKLNLSQEDDWSLTLMAIPLWTLHGRYPWDKRPALFLATSEDAIQLVNCKRLRTMLQILIWPLFRVFRTLAHSVSFCQMAGQGSGELRDVEDILLIGEEKFMT